MEAEAVTNAKAQLSSARASGDRRAEAKALISLAEAELAHGTAAGALQAANDAKVLYTAQEEQAGLAGALLLAASAQTKKKAPQAALSSATAAVDIFAGLGDKAGEAKAWQGIMGARMALGKYEEALKAGEAALVINIEMGDDASKAYTLLGIARAHTTYQKPQKAFKAGTMALEMFRRVGAPRMEQAALDLVVTALLAMGRKEEATRQATNGAAILEKNGHAKLAAIAMQTVVRVHVAKEDLVEALSVAERARTIFQELTERSLEAGMLVEVARLQGSLGQMTQAKTCAEEALSMYKNLGDQAGQSQATSMLGAIEDASALQDKDNQSMEEEKDLMTRVQDAFTARQGPEFREALEKAYAETRITAKMAEEFLQPLMKDDPSAEDFWLDNQPDDPDEGKDWCAKGSERNGIYLYFRWTMMGYGPGFRMLQTVYRKGQAKKTGALCEGIGSLMLKDDGEEWEEKSGYHPGLLDCGLQVGITRGNPDPHSSEIEPSS